MCSSDLTIIEAKLTTDNDGTYQNSTFLVPYGSLKTESSDIEKRIAFNKDEYQIEIKSSKFTPFVYLYTNKGISSFSENFFHLFPGEKKTISCRSNLTPANFTESLKIYSLNNYFQENI